MKITIPLIPLKVEQGGCHMLIKSRINSNIGGYIIIDTGASMSAFDKETFLDFSESLLNIKDIKSSGITNESLNAIPVIINKVFFGRYSFKNIEAVLIDLIHINVLYSEFTNKKVIGLIGGTFLKKYNAIIDYKNNKMKLEI